MRRLSDLRYDDPDLSVAEVAFALGVGQETVIEWILDGRLRAWGSPYRVTAREVLDVGQTIRGASAGHGATAWRSVGIGELFIAAAFIFLYGLVLVAGVAQGGRFTTHLVVLGLIVAGLVAVWFRSDGLLRGLALVLGGLLFFPIALLAFANDKFTFDEQQQLSVFRNRLSSNFDDYAANTWAFESESTGESVSVYGIVDKDYECFRLDEADFGCVATVRFLTESGTSREYRDCYRTLNDREQIQRIQLRDDNCFEFL